MVPNANPDADAKYFGRSVKRREDPRLLLGQGRFVADLKLPGQVEMMVVRSPHAHARIKSIDVRRALQHPKVTAVLTYSDIAGEVTSMPAFDVLPKSLPAFQKVLASGKVRYIGEPIAVLAATDRYVAEDAAELVDIEYEVLPAVTEIDQARAPDAPLLYEEFGTNTVHTYAQSVGDVDAAFAQAHRIYRETFSIHRYTGIPMETRGVLADASPASDSATLWSSTQFPHLLRARLAAILSLPEGKLRVVAPDVGGGFGVKEAVYCEEVLAILLSRRLGRPVRWIEDRAEHFASTTHGREQKHWLEAAVSEDGTITALKSVCVTSIGGAYASLSNAPGFYVSAILRGPYRIPHYRSEIFSVVTNKTPLNVYRGAGHPQAVLCMERMMDRIARDLGMDRAQLRLLNMLTPEELPSDRGVWLPSIPVIYDSGNYPACLRQALDLMKYADFPIEQKKARKEGKFLGMGLAFYIETTALGPYETATLRVAEDEKVTLLTGTSPHGQGTATTHAQMVADELGVPIENITVLHGDTAIVRDGIGTWGSRGGAVGGTAARLAAIKVKEKAHKLAAFLLQTHETDLQWTAGRVHLGKHPETGFSLGELVRESKAANRFPPDLDLTLEGDIKFEVPNAAYAYACHIAVVEVDVETGRIYVRRYGVAHDCGRIINPMIVAGQVVGGVTQGIGGTLLEDLIYDKNGRLLTTTLMDYLMPSVSDVPKIQLAHMETPTPHNPYGIKGAGEGGATGSPGALVNAIEDALLPFGVRINDDGPFTPTRVLELLKAARNVSS